MTQEGASPMRAILAGLAVDIGGSIVIATALDLLYALASSKPVGEALQDMPADPPVLVLGMLSGSLCSVAGGFVCARIARQREYRVGGVMAALSACIGAALPHAQTSADVQLLAAVTTAACVLLGVKYARAMNRRPG